MARVKAWVNYTDIPTAKPDGEDTIYVEEIPPTAIRCEEMKADLLGDWAFVMVPISIEEFDKGLRYSGILIPEEEI